MIQYIVLLRGINISGKNKVPMSELKKELECLGYQDVRTYLNSGNAIFKSNIEDTNVIKEEIQNMIQKAFALDIPVYITTENELRDLLRHTPEWWGTNQKEIYDNIIFILPPATYQKVIDTIGFPNAYEKIEEYKNHIFWSYDLKNYRKTNWWSKTASTEIAHSITIRTANTMKKILELMDKSSSM